MDRLVDPAFAPGESLILRYHRAIGFDELGRDDYRRVSLREGARILEFLEYKGVRIYLDDESTLMASGTFKSLEACFTMALCRKRGYRAAAFSSGANLGAALSLYGRTAGVETFFFHPDATSWKLDDAFFASPAAHVVSVDKPEREVKRAALLFAEMSGIPHIPAMEWRFVATGLRALFVFETMLERRLRFDWVSQTVCAGYGPIGFYDRVGPAGARRRAGRGERAEVPRDPAGIALADGAGLAEETPEDRGRRRRRRLRRPAGPGAVQHQPRGELPPAPPATWSGTAANCAPCGGRSTRDTCPCCCGSLRATASR